MANKQKIIIRSLIGCAGVVFLGFCALAGVMIYVANTLSWDTPIENNMDDPEFRRQIEGWLNLKFPDSAQWEKSALRPWLEWRFHGVFTLPKKDIELMFPSEKGEWRENEHDMLPYQSEDWLKNKNLDHFKVIQHEPDGITNCYWTIVVDNPPDADENQRVWVYIKGWDM